MHLFFNLDLIIVQINKQKNRIVILIAVKQ